MQSASIELFRRSRYLALRLSMPCNPEGERAFVAVHFPSLTLRRCLRRAVLHMRTKAACRQDALA